MHVSHADLIGPLPLQLPPMVLQGVTVLVATPGRLLDHLQNTKAFRTGGYEHLTRCWLALQQPMPVRQFRPLVAVWELLQRVW